MDDDIRIIRSERKSLTVQVLADGSVQVRAPRRLAMSAIKAFVAQHQSWIVRQQARQAAIPRQRWRHGDSLPVLGVPYYLELEQGRSAVRSEGCRLQVRLLHPDSEDDVALQVERWLRRQANEVYSESIDRQFVWFAAQGLQRPTLRIKKMRTRWGSLSARGYINLNLSLMHYPTEIVDYVVMHELCHLKYMHHGPEFHALMDARMPDWRERKKQLNAPQHR